jgi:ABC-2 type transport system permease protein
MNPRRIWAVTRKEVIHILRDPRSLVMGVAIPILLLLLFGYALSLDVDNVPLAVWDQSNSPQSRELVAGFTGSRYFSLALSAGAYPELERALDRGEVQMALVIPSDFASRLESGREAPVQIIADGSDANTAGIALGYADVVVRDYSGRIVRERIARQGGPSPAGGADLRPRVWFNADMESRNYIVPGLIAVIMMVIAALLTSLTVAREWESGTMEQLISTPLRGPELILGKLLPYFGIGMLDVLLSVLMGEFLFEVPLRGSPALLFLAAAVFLLGALSLGILISILAKGQLLASQLAMVLTLLPAFLLSGFMYDIRNMPAIIQAVTYLVPARYFVALLKGIYLKGAGLEFLAAEAALLALFGGTMFLLANLTFKKRMS